MNFRRDERGSRIGPGHAQSVEPLVVPLGGGSGPRWLTAEGAAAAAAVEPPVFPPEEFAERWRRAREELERRQLDGILVFRRSSVDYLSGFHTANPAPQPLLLTQDELRLYVFDIELGRALASATVPTVAYSVSGAAGGEPEDNLQLIVDDVARVLGKHGRLGVELADPRIPPPVVPRRLLPLMEAAGVVLQDARELVEGLRLILSPAEISRMDRAAAATQRGVEAAVEAVHHPGASDSAVAAAVVSALSAHANSVAVIPPMVATGARSGVWHSTARHEPIGAITLMEFAGVWDRYHAPVIITVSTGQGDELEDRLERRAQEALEILLGDALPGAIAGDVGQSVARSFGALGAGEQFNTNFGWAVGLDWAQGPDWRLLANPEPLQVGMALHLTVTLRQFGFCGVGLSHTVVLEASGPRILTGGHARILRNS